MTSSRILSGLVAALLTASLLSACSEDQAAPADKTKVTVSVLPPIAQPGPRQAPAADAEGVVTARVTPAADGLSATLQRSDGNDWKDIGEAELSDGTAMFRVPGEAAEGSTYRVQVTGDGVDATSGTVAAQPEQQLAFSDEFPGRALSKDWYLRMPEYNPEGRRRCSKAGNAAVSVGGGVVSLKVVEDPARAAERCVLKEKGRKVDYRYRLNGHIAALVPITHGIVAARVKFQRESGQHGSVWLQTAPGQVTPGAEIDIIEWFGEIKGSPGLASFTYHYDEETEETVKTGGWVDDPDQYLASKDDAWWKSYHVFSVEWTPDEYVFRIDGQETWRTSEGVSQVPEELILSLLSSDYELKTSKRLPVAMQVDWVRWWEAPAS